MSISGDDPRAAAGSPRYRRALIALFFAAVTTFAQVYSPQGLLPDIARDYGIGEGASSLAVGATTLGLAVGMLPWGRLSDRIGRLAALRWALAASVAVGLVVPFAPSFEMLVSFRFVEGLLLAGLPAVGVLALSETVAPLAFGAAIGSYVAGNSVGGLLGRLVSGWVGDALGWRWGLLAVTLLAAAAMVVFMVLMPRPAIDPPPALPLMRAAIENLRDPGTMVAVAQALLLMGGFVAIYNYLAFRLQHEPFGLTTAQTSLLFVAYLAGTVSSRAVWAVVARSSQVVALIGSLGVMLAGLFAMLMPWLPAVIAGLVVFTVGFFAAHSVALALTSHRSPPGAKSIAPSLYYLAYYAGSTVFGWLGGEAFSLAGWLGTSAMVAGLLAIAAALVWIHAARHGGPREVDAR